MPLILTYVLATAGAWCLFSADGFTWLLPALIISLFTHLTRSIPAATWVLLIFAGWLALWSGWAFRRASDPGAGIGTLLFGLTPMLQLLAVVLVLVPLLISVCWFYGPRRLDHSPQPTKLTPDR